MHALPTRKLAIDLTEGFDRHWHSGDAFRSAYFNALSMSFPVGEQYFIDSVRAGVALLPAGGAHAALAEAVRGFIAQEATHRHLHGLYNAELARQGLRNHWERWAARRVRMSRRWHVLHHLAITAAYEHLTAVLAGVTLRHADALDGAEPRMQLLWQWHAAEETEHRAVAFDLYCALGGGWVRRLGWYAYALTMFTLEATAQTAINLQRDGTLWRVGTGTSALRFAFGRHGLLWRTARPLLVYLRPGFHPDDDPESPAAAALAQDWLAANRHRFRVAAGRGAGPGLLR